jgi:hypothetical protein
MLLAMLQLNYFSPQNLLVPKVYEEGKGRKKCKHKIHRKVNL